MSPRSLTAWSALSEEREREREEEGKREGDGERGREMREVTYLKIDIVTIS